MSLPSLTQRIRDLLFRFPAIVARLGLVDRKRGEEAFELAMPVMVTGTVRTILRTADFFMVGLALPAAALAGLEFAFQYYFIGFGLALALSSGTISVVSRYKGANNHERADFVIKQSLWLAVILAVPLTAIAQFYATPLIDLLTNDPEAISQGAVYLQIVTYGLLFRFWTMIASRALQGSGNTRTPMLVNLVTIPTNIGLNAALIFGLGPLPQLGIAGAAWGTTIAEALSGIIFFYLLQRDKYEVGLRLGGKQWDTTEARKLVQVGAPLAGSRLVGTFGRFPFLFVLGVLGTPVVAAFSIGRRVIMLAMMPAWGYSTASSTLVGQALGAGNNTEATAYGWDTTRIALVTQLLIAAVMVVLARPISAVFTAETIPLTAAFIRVFAFAVGGFSVARTMRGALRGSGDTAWPFYGKILGLAARLSLVALALPVGLTLGIGGFSISPGLSAGMIAVYIAILVDFYIQAVVNTARFRSGQWQSVARRSEQNGPTGSN